MNYKSLDKNLIQHELVLIAKQIPTTYFIVINSTDGLKIASWTKGNPSLENSDDAHEEDRFVSMSAAMTSLSERVVQEMGGGIRKFSVFNGTKGTIFLIALEKDYILTFGVRELRTVDSVLVILQQWWDDLLQLLNITPPQL